MSFYPPAPPGGPANSRPSSYHSARTSHMHSPSASSARITISHPQQKPFLTPVYSVTAAYDPKSVTRTANNPPPPKVQPSAPYVHLDFHTNLADSRVAPDDSVAPVSRRAVTIVRFTTLALRLLQLLAAMGMLVLLLFLRKLEEAASYIVRVPPAVAIVHTVYAAYHLSGSHRLKTPGSSKAYFLFSSTIDLAIMSFYAFTAVLSFQQWQMPKMVWTSLFVNDARTVVLCVFLLACTAGGLTLITLATGLYLLRVYRILTSLPPDMNPFVISERAEKIATEKQKRWSASTTSTAVGGGEQEEEAAFIPGTERKMNFLDSRPETPNSSYVQSQPRTHTPATPSEGRYRDSYAELDLSRERLDLQPEMDLADSFSYRAGDDRPMTANTVRTAMTGNTYSERPATSNTFGQPLPSALVAAQGPPTPKHKHLKRGSVADSISSFESISKQVRPLNTPPRTPAKRGGTPVADSPVRVDSPSRSSQKSWGSGGVQGFSKNSLLTASPGPEGNGGARFRKISAEAN